MPASAHALVPRITVATLEEVDELLKKYGIGKEQLPLMKPTDAALPEEAQPGDIVIIHRISPVTKKEEPYYRLVIEE
jgi:DNA-directed RNA polymerase subunit H